METRPRAVLLKFPGTNCDRETARALRTVGFHADVVPSSALDSQTILASDLVVLPGGFSYGDYVMAGRLAQLEIERRLGDTLVTFRDRGGLLLGICNGFQILMHLGLLPSGSLVGNDNGRFICRWVPLEVTASNDVYLSQLPDRFELPVANAEGRFVAPEDRAEAYLRDGHVPLQYGRNPNGSIRDIAALQDETGRVFGLMPHPERFLRREDHYDKGWHEDEEWGWGYYFFKSIAEYLQSRSASPDPAVRSS